jgi:hypothetical protein
MYLRTDAVEYQTGRDLGEFLRLHKLPLLLGIPHNWLGYGSAQPVRHDRGCAVAFFLGWAASLYQPGKDVNVEHLREYLCNASKVLFKV